jgi:hypothetical protein
VTRIHFSVHGDEDVEHLLLGMAVRAENTRPALQAIATALRARQVEVFDTEGFGEWEPLADSTVERKAREGLEPGILRATDEMRDAFIGGPGHLEHISDTELIFGVVGEPYEKARRHKTGTSRMPARDPIPFDELAEKGVAKAVQRFIVETEGPTGGVGTFAAASLDPFGLQ